MFKINEHIGEEFNFPVEARQLGKQGKTYTTFVIEKDGSISTRY